MWMDVIYRGEGISLHEHEDLSCMYNWLRKNKKTLEGCSIYDEVIDMYIQLDKKFQEVRQTNEIV
ncbi:hypothetical protein [Paenilisteria newyorkensis]|uniref:hypothetical protein n=1 Tax=Listeria newyorkensis TaxID=1497681 RepID=UPI002358384D|nr:hypothetical protein [Listeria newyorkensis]WAO22055.1 hypothetical protein OTR81_01815 [Listeria newyorkensis]